MDVKFKRRYIAGCFLAGVFLVPFFFNEPFFIKYLAVMVVFFWITIGMSVVISIPQWKKRAFLIRQFPKHKGLYRKLEFLFWKILCPYPDQTKIGMWWYRVSGNIARYFHLKTCNNCREKLGRSI